MLSTRKGQLKRFKLNIKATEEDIINFLKGIPKQKFHCACLVKRTLQRAIDKYKKPWLDLTIYRII